MPLIGQVFNCLLFCCSGGNAQSFLGLTSGRRRASHGSVFHFRVTGRDVSFPDGTTDEGVLPGDQESHRGSLLLGGSVSQQGPLPRSPLPEAPNSGSGLGEDGQTTLLASEIVAPASGTIDISVSL